ncbi:hypothetical protein CHS0354_002951 [Potamilus streckersoni]|uniref:Uncharacterized protein n=1 Tax=Potamilus streckersoni TaxID=2493646 RepID=A0AAE0RS12_9BIVA|nr:hypothetical protein CHS0354_002951 [Potamilus streckersoni]
MHRRILSCVLEFATHFQKADAMKSLVIFFVLILDIFPTIEGDTKRCFCKAVDADNSDNVFHDFRAIESHSNWLSVGCGRLDGCSDKCEGIVKDWLCNSKEACKAVAKGKQVRHYFQASVCNQAAGSVARPCGCVGEAFDNIPKCQFECLSQLTVAAYINCFNACFSG